MSEPLNKVLIPLIRRVMPSVIAQDIIGVSPMIGPAGSIFSLRARYFERNVRYKVNPAIYNAFLRLNNRRKTQGDCDFESAKYYSIQDVNFADYRAAQEWSQTNFGQHGFYWNKSSNKWWFTKIEDSVLFKLTWCDNLP
jgi:hypothetical protein